MHKDYVFLNKLYNNMGTNSNKKGNIKNIKNHYCKTKNALEWFNYLLYIDIYPTSFKYYVFISIYNLDIKLNKKVLSLCYDNYFKNVDFINIYNYCKNKARIEKRVSTLDREDWVNYTSYTRLNKDLKGFDTNFGIEGIKASKEILETNSIDIYYLNHKPAILLVYNKYSIVDLKINDNILLLKDILNERVKNFINGELYLNKISNSITLEEIYKKYEYHLFLNRDDLVFLYEIDFPVNLLVSTNKKEKILKSRDIFEDMATIFECNINKIGHDIKDLKRNILVYIGNIDSKVDAYPKYVIGDITLIKDENVIMPYYLKGDLTIKNIVLSDMVLPSIVMGNVDIQNAKTIENVVFSKKVLGNLYLDNAYYIKNCVLPYSVNDLYIETLINDIELPSIHNKLYLNEHINDVSIEKVKTFN